MSLKDIVEGDCGRESAAAEFSSHFVQDIAFRDAGVEHPFQDAGGNISSPEQMVNQFMAESGIHNAPQSFRMDSLLEEMREIESSVTQHPPVQAPGVAVLAAADPLGIAGEDYVWAEQYLESGKQFDEAPDGEAIWSAAQGTNPDMAGKQEYEFGYGPNWMDDYLSGQNHQMMEEHFKAQAQDTQDTGDLKEAAKELINTVKGTSIEHTEFLEYFSSLDRGEVLECPAHIVNHDLRRELAEKYSIEHWTDEYLELTKKTDDYYDMHLRSTDYRGVVNAQVLWNTMTEQWDNLVNGSGTEKKRGVNIVKEIYSFIEKNPVAGCSNALEKGKERLAEGDLIGAILYFEVACKEDAKNSEAWLLLGNCQALNEQDPAAIICLMHALKLDPSNLKAMKTLAVSLTNENYPNHACYILEKWLRANPKYSDLIKNPVGLLDGVSHEETESVMDDVFTKAGLRSSFLKGEYFEKVKDRFIEAARRQPHDVDADVQICLGILFNLNHEIDKAVDCFRTALQVRQDDFQLWNSYGATLANGGRSEEAVHAYRRALELYPGFVRARYNVGITCCTLRAYREAGQHFLISLNQQASATGYQNYSGNSGATMSDNIWDSLRTVVTLMDDTELLKKVEKRDLPALMKAFGVE